MTAAVKTAISTIRPDSSSAFFLDEVLASVAANRIPDEYAKLPGFLPVLVLIAKSTVHRKTDTKKSALDQAARINGNWVIPLSLRPATAQFENPKPIDTFVFGQVTVNISTM